MKMKRVSRFIADCGRGFWNKNSCTEHEINCKCWTNPKYRTCKTCKYKKIVHDSNGMEHEPQYLHTWSQIECQNPKFNYDIHFHAAHKNAEDLNINCAIWESKNVPPPKEQGETP